MDIGHRADAEGPLNNPNHSLCRKVTHKVFKSVTVYIVSEFEREIRPCLSMVQRYCRVVFYLRVFLKVGRDLGLNVALNIVNTIISQHDRASLALVIPWHLASHCSVVFVDLGQSLVVSLPSSNMSAVDVTLIKRNQPSSRQVYCVNSWLRKGSDHWLLGNFQMGREFAIDAQSSNLNIFKAS